MAKRKRETKFDPPSSKDGFVGYVNYNISKAEKAKYLKWVAELDSDWFWSELSRLIGHGFKFSCKPDTYGGGVQAALTCSDSGSNDDGLVLTARAPDTANAIMLLLFKNAELLGGMWFAHFETNKEIDEWG